MIEISTNNVNWLSAAGIAWDISGAIAISRNWFFISNEKLERQAGSYWGASPATARSYVETRLDTRFGLAQLVLGFLLQLAASIGIVASFEVWAAMMIAIACAWIFYLPNFQYWMVRESLRISVVPDAQEEIWRKHYQDVPNRIWERVLLNEGISFKEPD